ncbi:MAG: hypothetical protein AAF611_16525 [Bacteroidota bacterium]
MKIQSIDDFAEAMKVPQLQEEYTTDPKKFKENYFPPMKNEKIFKLVILIIGVVLVLSVISFIIITLYPFNGEDGEIDIPDPLITVASTAIGAITGLLVHREE